jgi:hypothetical protein
VIVINLPYEFVLALRLKMFQSGDSNETDFVKYMELVIGHKTNYTQSAGNPIEYWVTFDHDVDAVQFKLSYNWQV